MIRGGARWTLAREEAARRLAAAGNARNPARLARVIRRLGREAERDSTRDLIARRAADDLLDAAAAECFADPVAATDVVRWNQLRRSPEQTLADLDRGPAAFGAMRLQYDLPALWDALPEPRHPGIPAWRRFGDAARTWVDVQGGRPWTPPGQFPPPAGLPALPAKDGREGGPAPLPVALPRHAPPAAEQRVRPPDRGLTR